MFSLTQLSVTKYRALLKALEKQIPDKNHLLPGCTQLRRHTGRQWPEKHHGFGTLVETGCWGGGRREGYTRTEAACLGVSAGVFPAPVLEMPGGRWLPSE